MSDSRMIWNKGVGQYWKSDSLIQLYKHQVVDMARKRGIKTSGRNKEELIKDIKAHHKQLKFSRFLDLPAELRVLVYEFYFDNFKLAQGCLTVPSQPPITLANSLLRTEATPLFYAHVRFNVQMIRPLGPPPPLHELGNATDLETAAWLAELDGSRLKGIKHLRLTVSKLAINLDLDKSDPLEFLEHLKPHPGVPRDARQTLDEICQGLEGGRLSPPDLTRLRRAALVCFVSIERSRRIGANQ